jgi:D-alanyl-D-alanine carboxypeptidase
VLPHSGKFLAVAAMLAVSLQLRAQLSADTEARIDSIVTKTIADNGTPSVSLAVVKDGEIAYVKAYGSARLDPALPASVDTRYEIGSVSKQFLAAAMMLLVEDGNLSLDDRVGRFLPELTRADDVTIRQLLSHLLWSPESSAYPH